MHDAHTLSDALRPGCVALLTLVLSACGGGDASNPITVPDPTGPATIEPIQPVVDVSFANVTVAAAVNVEHRLVTTTPTDPERITAGVAAGDYDGDGYVDLYVIGGDSDTPNLLYRNLADGSLRFEEVSEQAGVRIVGQRGAGATFVDVNADGMLDLFIGAVMVTPSS